MQAIFLSIRQPKQFKTRRTHSTLYAEARYQPDYGYRLGVVALRVLSRGEMPPLVIFGVERVNDALLAHHLSVSLSFRIRSSGALLLKAKLICVSLKVNITLGGVAFSKAARYGPRYSPVAQS